MQQRKTMENQLMSMYSLLNAMVHKSETPPPFYSQEFELADFVLLRNFNMEQRDITQNDCCDIFRHLIRESETSDEK